MTFKRFLTIILGVLATVIATANDTTTTRYVKGEFISCCTVDAHAPLAKGDSIVDKLTEQITTDFDSLFTWAFKGIGKQNDDVHDEVILVFKETEFDKMSGLCHMLVDIQVSKNTTFRDVPIDSRLVKSVSGDTIRLDVDIFYSNAVLKKAFGTLFAYPIDEEHITMGLQINVRFGWFFNLFITQRRFRNLVEWRMQGFMNNLREEAEKH